jgi:hypothetical protein
MRCCGAGMLLQMDGQRHRCWWKVRAAVAVAVRSFWRMLESACAAGWSHAGSMLCLLECGLHIALP